MRYEEAVNRYIAEAGRLHTEASVLSFRKVMNHLHKFAGRDCKLEDIDQHVLTDWCLSNNPAPSTVKKRRAHARSFFGWCAYKEWIKTDPASGLGYSVNPGRGTRRTHTWLSKSELVDLIRAQPADQAGERDRLILMLGTLCGLRAEEICNLRWDDFSSDWSKLTLVGKGQKPATIGVPAELRSALVRWHEKRPAGAVAVLPTMYWCNLRDSRVRVAQWDRPLQYHGLLYAVKAAGDVCGLRLQPHDLRRTFAGILEESGVPVTDISRAMRHNNVGTTSRYLEKNPRRTVEVTEGLTLGL
jgi:integrase/recombinase XerD